MNECLAHRGPDEEGIYLDGPVGLAHKRLSIVDLETGSQPIFNESDSVVVVFNGEIYNHLQLRERLERAGHTFRSNTDTEVLVHGYEEHGPSITNHLRGMFAFGLWDADEGRLLLARDPIGIKPLFLANDGDRVAFASELPALFESGVDLGDIDETGISQFFGLGYIPAPHTAFRNVRKLRPGELVTLSGTGIEFEQYYTPSVPARNPTFGEAATELRSRIVEAVETRLMSDVPLGAFLSGGIDSSIIVGAMAECMDDPVKTFTAGFDESRFDEAAAAREVANYHRTDHTEFTVTHQDVQSAIPEVLDRLGEPFADQSLIPSYVISQELSRDVKVALSGDGADELFAGYDRYRGEYYSSYYRRLPAVIRKNVIKPAIDTFDVSRDSRRGEFVRKIKKFANVDQSTIADRHFEWARIADDAALSVYDSNSPSEVCRTYFDQAHARVLSDLPRERRDDLSRIQAVDTRFGLPNQILNKTDLASMYNSQETRVPFLDTNVVEYAISLPRGFKISPRGRKRVLKRAFADLLPESILARNKQGFDMPIGAWFKNELRSEFEETLSSLDRGVIDTDVVMDRFEEHRSGRREHGKFLWSTYVFARWQRRMVDRGVLSEPT